MDSEKIHNTFLKAVDEANSYPELLPTDIKLKFYAYYKQATEDSGLYRPTGEIELRNAFKVNALLQVRGLSKDEAKLGYIKLVKTYLRS
ncbi:acyl-CoA-binding protein [Aquimarina agarivorans]|uniref:acyl-CoA-binding protein n=1 Tax=Aquimarina agarivorans TaxID=980584 RepID=UPI000248EACA|nr:acyl-CoA-binding protein [Aquimarina agarivorans]